MRRTISRVPSRAITSLIVTILCGAVVSFAGDHVGNGGGIAEKNILIAYERLEQFINLCTHSEACKISERERGLLTKIVAALPLERASQDQIKFASEKASPGFFIIDGEVKVAKTGSSVGSPIYFNSDLLYTKNAVGRFESLSLADCVAQLIHEMGHHHGDDFSHAQLDLVGVRVSLVLTQHIQETPFLPLDNQVRAIVINETEAKSFSKIILQIFGDLIDVSKEFEDSLVCANLADSDSTSSNNKITVSKSWSAIFHNVYWSDYKIGKDKGRFTLKGNITNICQQSDKFNFKDNSYKATIHFDIRKVATTDGKTQWQVKKDSLKVRQHYEPWWFIIKIPDIL